MMSLQIRIQSTPMKIGLQIDKPIQQIEQRKAIQSIEQPKAKVSIETVPAKLNIDQSKARADLGFKPIPQLAAEFAKESIQAGLEGIARRARQGDELMKIENKGNPIIAQAIENGNRPEKQFNIGWIPRHGGIEIHYEPGKAVIDVEEQKPIINVQIQKPIHEYQPGKVSTYIEQWNSLQIDFVPIIDKTI